MGICDRAFGGHAEEEILDEERKVHSLDRRVAIGAKSTGHRLARRSRFELSRSWLRDESIFSIGECFKGL